MTHRLQPTDMQSFAIAGILVWTWCMVLVSHFSSSALYISVLTVSAAFTTTILNLW